VRHSTRKEHANRRAEFYVFGHPYYADPADNPPDQDFMVWRYLDTGELVEQAAKRQCPHCNRYPTRRGHDPCLGNLSGAAAACCGHGVEDGYIRFEGGITLRGKFEHIARRWQSGGKEPF
jgi:hypothetical protein